MEDVEAYVKAAKAELQKSEGGQTSPYDHIVNMIRKIMTERPDAVYNNFENLSRDSKRDAFKGDEDRLQADEVNSNAYVISSKQKPLFTRSEEEEMEPEGFDGECVLPNILELSNHFEETGINLGRDETFRIYLGTTPSSTLTKYVQILITKKVKLESNTCQCHQK